MKYTIYDMEEVLTFIINNINDIIEVRLYLESSAYPTYDQIWIVTKDSSYDYLVEECIGVMDFDNILLPNFTKELTRERPCSVYEYIRIIKE